MGPPVANVFSGGVLLSIAAAIDLQVMIKSYLKQQKENEHKQLQLRLPLDYREKARGGLGPKALGHLRKGEAKGKRLAKQAKGRGAAAGLRQPRAINASAGKRRC